MPRIKALAASHVRGCRHRRGPWLRDGPEAGQETLVAVFLIVPGSLPNDPSHTRSYLPSGAQWTNAWTGATVPSGTEVTAEAPLEQIPLFLRDGAQLRITQD